MTCIVNAEVACESFQRENHFHGRQVNYNYSKQTPYNIRCEFRQYLQLNLPLSKFHLDAYRMVEAARNNSNQFGR